MATRAGRRWEYKVFMADHRFNGAVDAEKLERELNDYAVEGWRVVSMVSEAGLCVTLERELADG